MDGEAELLTIGQLARHTGLSPRTIRFWSDAGVVPPAARSVGGYRLYDAPAVARLELVRTLRELGLGLGPIERILRDQGTLAEAIDVHSRALDAQIRLLRSHRAILRAIAKNLDTGKMPHMHKLARKTAQERQKIIDEFVSEIFAEADSDETRILAEWMREMPAELPEDPAPDQVEAWIELGELVADEDFRTRLRDLVLSGQQDSKLEFGLQLRPLVLQHAGAALGNAVEPDTPHGRIILNRVVPPGQTPEETAELIAWLEQVADARIERYWQLLALVNNRIAEEPAVPAFQWLLAALRAHR